jgi:transposase
MSEAATTSCPHCAKLEQRIAVLEAELAKAKKTSTNSSKPPSSDIVKPPRPTTAGKKKRKRGGQPGHPRHQRQPFAEGEIDQSFDYYFPRCPDCGGQTTLLETPHRVIQQVEILTAPIVITEHRGLTCQCQRCRKTFSAPLPDEVRSAGLIGPRLTALVAYLKGACHASFSTIRKFLRDVVHVSISNGQLRKLCAKVSDSLEDTYQELLRRLPKEERLNVDETGHRENGRALWTWCFRADLYTLFRIDPSRSSQVLIDVLGKEFAGVLGCDYFSAYRKYMRDFNILVQFCLAHLLRDIKFLAQHPHSATRAYGGRVLAAARAMFAVIHRRESMSAGAFAVELKNAGEELEAQAVWRVPATREAQNLSKRFQTHGESYLRFITTPGIDPTNNLAEQAIRFVVLDRHVTQGSRSLGGRCWLERIWTAVATCSQQGRSVFEFLHESVVAYFTGAPAPSLIPNTS